MNNTVTIFGIPLTGETITIAIIGFILLIIIIVAWEAIEWVQT